MLEKEYGDIFKDNLFNAFIKIFIIDVLSDKVFVYEKESSSFVLKNNISYFEFVQSISPKIHPNDINNFFDTLSINKLNSNNNFLTYKYRYMENDNYLEYINLISAFNKNQNNLVFVGVLKSSDEIKQEIFDNKLELRIDSICNSVADTLLEIYNTLDSVNENKETSRYITNLLDNLIRQVPELNKQFEKDITNQVNKKKNSLLIIDDDVMSRNLIKKTFQDEYDILVCNNGDEAIKLLDSEHQTDIVGVFLDLFMPVVDGFGVLDYLRNKNLLSKMPVIIISGTEEKETRQRVYQYNIADLLEKPFNLDIIKYRTKNLINLYRTSSSLNNMILSQQKDLLYVVENLASAYKIDNKKRNEDISKYFKLIAEKVKNNYPEYKLNDYMINKATECLDLCNVGYYTLPKRSNKSTFTQEEIKRIRQYPKISKIIVEKILYKYNDADLIQIAGDLALYSREEYNGNGYPFGLKGDSIPILSQCNYVANILEIILSNEKNLSNAEIISKYFNNSNMTFNPKIIEIIPQIIDELRENKGE